MKIKQLKVYATPNACIPDFKTIGRANIPRRFIGRQFDPSLGEKGGFPLKSEAETIDALPEYIAAIKCGDLLAADIETAQLCGVAFVDETQNIRKK